MIICCSEYIMRKTASRETNEVVKQTTSVYYNMIIVG
jgi:hypothetical protein